jgi:hypothetical protein
MAEPQGYCAEITIVLKPDQGTLQSRYWAGRCDCRSAPWRVHFFLEKVEEKNEIQIWLG